MKKQYSEPEVTFVDFTYSKIVATSNAGCWDDSSMSDEGIDTCMNS